MLRLAGAHAGKGALADPMCGAGTIPIEAVRINPGLEVAASDWDAETVEVARETIAENGLELPVETLDARNLGEVCPGRFDYIVTDPPYGLRQAKRTSIARLYRGLVDAFGDALKERGRIVLIVVKYRAFLSALEGSSLKILHEREVDLGGIRPRIYVLGR
jgi:putative N6-adenine-specific DNA methylase/tRNA (guanine6-N2)-methyltransferase